MRVTTGKLRGLKNFAPGISLRICAILCRTVFLLLIVPGLPEGELARYVLMVTAALMAGRLASIGMEEQLALRIRGSYSSAEEFSVIYSLFIALAVLLMSFCHVLQVANFQLSIIVVSLLASIYASQFVLTGLVRSVRVFALEVLSNLYWVFFVSLCLIVPAESAGDYVFLMAASSLINHLLVIRLSRIKVHVRLDVGSLKKMLIRIAKQSWKKILSAFLMLANLRGLVLWPSLLMLPYELDSIAFSLMIAEVAYQIGMVVVNRRFSDYCTTRKSFTATARDARTVATLLLAAFSVGSFCVYIWGDTIAGILGLERYPLKPVAVTIAAYGFMCGFVLLRYAVWAVADFSWAILVFEIVCMICILGTVLVIDQHFWAQCLAVSFFCLFALTYFRMGTIAKRSGNPVVDC